MNTITFNKQFDKIFKDNPDMQFAIGFDDGKHYLAVFEGELDNEPLDLNKYNLLFYEETTKQSEMDAIRQKAINYFK